MRDGSMTFGSPSLAAHLLRGALGAAALAASILGYDVIGWPALLPLGVTVWAFRGCPMCWTIGLAETLAVRFLVRAEDGAVPPRTRGSAGITARSGPKVGGTVAPGA